MIAPTEHAVFRFGGFTLHAGDRRLTRNGAAVDVSARYLDALILLVRDHGRLVSKDRFMEEVWRGVPVTDEALTQCVRTLRRQLGDDAGSPRFIETVPRYGYRFIATVEQCSKVPSSRQERSGGVAARDNAVSWLLVSGAGTIGAGVAGTLGGLIYGSFAASAPHGTGVGGISVLLVTLWLTLAAAVIGGAGCE